jgi:hypothetical protein
VFLHLADPFKPEGIRSVLQSLYMEARCYTRTYLLFYVDPVDAVTRGGEMSALVDVHPITGRGFCALRELSSHLRCRMSTEEA